MLIDEQLELLVTVTDGIAAKSLLHNIVDEAKWVPRSNFFRGDDCGEESRLAQIAEQADALADIDYYCHDAAVKVGVDLSRVLDVVHAANMAKRDPATGGFLKSSIGKVVKPAGWTPPDVEGEVARQVRDGSWYPS